MCKILYQKVLEPQKVIRTRILSQNNKNFIVLSLKQIYQKIHQFIIFDVF